MDKTNILLIVVVILILLNFHNIEKFFNTAYRLGDMVYTRNKYGGLNEHLKYHKTSIATEYLKSTFKKR